MPDRPEKGQRESRQVEVAELRADGPDGTITGYAAVFDQPADVFFFEEVIRPGAFKRTIGKGADIHAFWNHDSGKILGATKNKTLKLREDDHGLKVEIHPPDTPTAQEVRQLIREGFIDKMSFGFEVVQETWTTDRKGKPDLRELTEIKLYEVSPVPIPAYDGTAVTARNQGERQQAEEETPQDGNDPAPENHSEPIGAPVSVLSRQLKLTEEELDR